MSTAEPCEQCGHDFDEHLVLASATGEPLDGGVIVCPHCDCVATWSVTGRDRPPMPEPEELTEIRQFLGLELPQAAYHEFDETEGR